VLYLIVTYRDYHTSLDQTLLLLLSGYPTQKGSAQDHPTNLVLRIQARRVFFESSRRWKEVPICRPVACRRHEVPLSDRQETLLFHGPAALQPWFSRLWAFGQAGLGPPAALGVWRCFCLIGGGGEEEEEEEGEVRDEEETNDMRGGSSEMGPIFWIDWANHGLLPQSARDVALSPHSRNRILLIKGFFFPTQSNSSLFHSQLQTVTPLLSGARNGTTIESSGSELKNSQQGTVHGLTTGLSGKAFDRTSGPAVVGLSAG
jgi:hypothetical protein